MDAGAHIPTYLLCEQLAGQGQVADLFPPDERGSRILAETARSVVVLQPSAARFSAAESSSIVRLVSRPDAVPLAKGIFDLVLSLSVDRSRTAADLEVLVRSVRELLKPSGIAAIAVPNPSAGDVDVQGASRQPDLLDFERSLRRHFPHVSLFAQQPLHGAVLSPLGRRAATDAPILDDRLLSEGGELPTHFVALCSPRYHKPVDATIARLPFRELAERVRTTIDKLEGTVSVVREESETRARRVASLTAELEETRAELVHTREDNRELASLRNRISELERQLIRREQLLTEAERIREDQILASATSDDQLHDARRELRRLERQVSDVQRERDLALKEREDAEQERLGSTEEIHRARTDVKAKQREVDDALEQLAGAESELDALRKEAARQRRELVSARERARQLELAITELESLQTDSSALESELQRIREHAGAERDKLESRAEDEHRQLLEAISAREQAVRQSRAVDVQLQEAEAARAEARVQLERIEQQLADKEDELEQLRRQSLEAEEVAKDLGRMTQEREADLERTSHEVTVLAERAEQAEQRALSLEETNEELRGALAEAEAGLLEQDAEYEQLRTTSKQVKLLENNLDQISSTAEARIAELEAALETSTAEAERLGAEFETAREQAERRGTEIERLRPNASSAESARQRAVAAEARVAELESMETELRAQLAEGEGDMREQLQAAAERIESLEAQTEELRGQLAEAELRAADLVGSDSERDAVLNDLRERLKDTEARAAEIAGSETELRDQLTDSEERLALAEAEKEEIEAKLTERAARTQRAEIEVARLTDVERELRAHLGDTKGRTQRAEVRTAELESETAALRSHFEEAVKRVAQLESDFQAAMDALAETEGGKTLEAPTAAERIRAMKAEIRRLRAENETELLKVREDLEAELRTVNTQLEARQGEIWELTEEVVRLRALAAASAASAERTGDDDGIRRNLAEQEARIDELTEEREALKGQCEQLSRSLELRKKNIKILAELFKRERQQRLESEPPPPGDGSEGPEQPRSLVTKELNIKQLLAEAGGDPSDDIDLFDDETDGGDSTDPADA